jgi:hypothetical protein
LEVELRKEDEGQVLVPSSAPAIKATIDLATSMLLLNKIAMYLGRAGCEFDVATLGLETWYDNCNHCNATMVRTQCSILGQETKGDKLVLVSRLLEAKARPVLPVFISACLARMRSWSRGAATQASSTSPLPSWRRRSSSAPSPPLPPPVPDPKAVPPLPMAAMLRKIAVLEARLASRDQPPAPPAVLAQLMATAAEAAANVALTLRR